MFSFTVKHVGLYRHAQQISYIVPCPTIGLTLSGLKHFAIPGMDLVGENGAGFFFNARGTPLSFAFGPERENFAILLESPDIKDFEDCSGVYVHMGQDWIKLPCFIPIAAERLPGWRVELEKMLAASRSPTPRNRMRMELGVLNILRHMIDRSADTLAKTPAGRLKDLVDADTSYSQTIEELSASCGYSSDHLRLLFIKEFGSAPKQYRDRRRMAAAMDLVANSQLSVKEISSKMGFSQVSHFSAIFHEAHALAPREAIKRFRHGWVAPSTAKAKASPPAQIVETTEDYCGF